MQLDTPSSPAQSPCAGLEVAVPACPVAVCPNRQPSWIRGDFADAAEQPLATGRFVGNRLYQVDVVARQLLLPASVASPAAELDRLKQENHLARNLAKSVHSLCPARLTHLSQKWVGHRCQPGWHNSSEDSRLRARLRSWRCQVCSLIRVLGNRLDLD